MSINDLLDSDVVLPAMMLIFVIAIIAAVPVGLARSKKMNNSIYGDDEYGLPLVEKNARIITRRTTAHPLNQTTMINAVVFELADGSRVELAIKDSNTYGTMVEGDCGTLRYRGKKFFSFERNV